MTKKYLQLLTLSLIVALSLAFADVALSQTWQEPQNSTPPGCTTGDDGCYVPINVSNKAQTKTGILTLINGIFLKGTSMVESDINFIGNLKFLRFSATGEEVARNSNDGKVGRLTGSNTNLDNRKVLDIIGVRQDETDIARSPSVKNRLVRIWDNLWVSGDIRARNYYICNDAGSCSIFTGGSDSWSKVVGSTPGSIYYDKGVGGNVGIGNNAPAALLDLGSNTYTGPAYLRLNSASDRTAGVRWADSGTDIWYLYKNNVVGSGTKKDLILADGPNVADTKVTFSNGSFAMTVKGGLRANSLQGDVLVVNNANSVEPTNTGIKLGNSRVTGDYVLYVKGTPTNPSTGDVYLKPISEIAGISSDVWVKSGTKIYPKTISDYVGIGTLAPTGILHVVNNNKTALRIGTGGDFQTNDAPGSAWNNFGSNDANSPIANFFNSAKGVAVSVSKTGFTTFADGIATKGSSIFEGQVQVNANTIDNSLKIGTGLANDGKIGYKLNTAGPSNNLDIIGVSQNGSGASGDRRVKIWDNLTVAGISTTTNLVVLGTTTTRNLYVSNNIFAQNLCTRGGVCLSITDIIQNITNPVVNTGDILWKSIGTRVVSNRMGGQSSVVINSDNQILQGNSLQVKMNDSKNSGLVFQNADGTKTWRFIFGKTDDTNPNGFSINDGSLNVFQIDSLGKTVISKGLDIANGGDLTITNGSLCLNGECRTTWANGSSPVRIMCLWNRTLSSGAVANSCVAVEDEGNYILRCPASYPNVISGGAWCNSAWPAEKYLRESRPNSLSEWKVGCSFDANGVKSAPNGASLVCSN